MNFLGKDNINSESICLGCDHIAEDHYNYHEEFFVECKASRCYCSKFKKRPKQNINNSIQKVIQFYHTFQQNSIQRIANEYPEMNYDEILEVWSLLTVKYFVKTIEVKLDFNWVNCFHEFVEVDISGVYQEYAGASNQTWNSTEIRCSNCFKKPNKHQMLEYKESNKDWVQKMREEF